MSTLASLLRLGAAASLTLCATAVLLPSLATAADSAEQARLANLSATVRAAEAVRAVKRLQNSYSHYLNDGLWNDAADLMTANAVGDFAGETVSGKQAIQQFLMQQAGRTQAGLDEGQLNLHLVLQPIITLGADGHSAKGAWHEVSLLGHYGKDAEWQGGIYENDYVLEDGVWKISKLGFHHQYEGAYADYGHKSPGAWNVPYHFEAAHVGVSVPDAALKNLAAEAQGDNAAILEARIQRLQDETDVQNLQLAFGYYLDRKLWDDVADLFTASGSLEMDQRGSYRGNAHIRQALEAFYGATPLQYGELFDHIMMGTVVTLSLDGLQASARSYTLNQLGRNGEYARWEEGTYENRFIKEAGIWKISEVHYFPRFTSDYDKGWAEDAQPAPGVNANLPPDEPPSQQYTSYPASNYVELHFANPVTGKAVAMPGAAVAIAQVPVAPAGAVMSVRKATTSAPSIADLELQAKRVIAVDAVENLNSSYGYYIDESAWDNMADTYSLTAGAKEITGAGVYVGQERIRKVLNLRGPAGGRTPTFFTIHQLTQPVIHIAEDGQSAKARFRLFQSGGNADGSSGSWIGGIYENTAVFENGEWKFGIQDLHHLFNASYRNGWARFGTAAPAPVATPTTAQPSRNVQGGGIQQGLGGARGPNSFARDFPPDHQIRSRQYAFPEITEPAFHYRNPVSGRSPAELLP